LDAYSDLWKSMPDQRPAELAQQLTPGEEIIASFEIDLDERLHFAVGLVALTNRRLLATSFATAAAPLGQTPRSVVETNGSANSTAWRSWVIADSLELRITESGGIGTLELRDTNCRVALWRYTAARSGMARSFEAYWTTLQSRRANIEVAEALPTVCPSCGEVITSEDRICAACAAKAPPPTTSSLYRLMKFARRRAGMAALGLLLTIVANAVGLIPPYLTKPLVDNVLIPREHGDIVDVRLVYFCLTGLFGAAIFAWLLNWARLFVTAWVSERIAADLRGGTYAHLQSLSLEFFGGKRTGDLMARVDTDSDRICVFLSVSLVDFVNDLVMIVLTSILLLSMDFRLALCTLITFPVIVWMIYVVKSRLRHGFNQSTVAMAQLSSVVADTIPGIRVVKAFAQERREVERFQRANLHLLSVNDRLNIIWSFFGPLVSLLSEIGLLAVWGFGVWLVFSSSPGSPALKVGTLTATVLLMSRFYGRMESLIRIVYSTQRAAASAQRIFEILDRSPSVPEPIKPVHPGRIQGRIELRGVRFKYGPREVIHGIDLQIEPGEMIGLVGPTGAGKSTLINLICRFFDVAEGAILVDGVDIRSYPIAGYRKNIGIVLQDPFLFYGTIAENIAYGRPEASHQEIVAAARAARAHDFILQLPDGYDSLVGERGQSLSGGERQRISIARALLIDPRILILDEATSSVDTETEREIQIALDNLIQGRTTLAIAHRLSTLRKANRLVVIERGRVAEIGKHADLLREEGAYARLHKAQMELVQGIGA
jgi:ATP-binding cassette, subfamily B, bacterial